jgi:3-dehydroquinate dehydratase-1
VQAKPILVNGKPLAGGRPPAVCAPLVGRSRDQLLAEAQVVAAKQPDLLEWRIDFFAGIADTALMLKTAAAIRQAAPGIPLLITRRSTREGGEPISLSEPQVVALYRAFCEQRLTELIDVEMGSDIEHVRELRACTRAQGVGMVLSHHNFSETPPLDQLLERFERAQQLDGDVAKVAVMPRQPEDVLRLLEATVQASRRLSIPVVSMSMGAWGSVSRLCGGAFGSALTFAVGQTASAPGQMPIEDMRTGLAILDKALGR